MRLIDVLSPPSPHSSFLMERVISNIDEVRAKINFLSDFVANPIAKKWFAKQLFLYIVNRLDDPEVIQQTNDSVSANSPSWVKSATSGNAPVYFVNLEFGMQVANRMTRLHEEIGNVLQWLNRKYGEGSTEGIFLNWEQALEKAMRGDGAETERDSSPNQRMEGEETLKKYDDGFEWVVLSTEECQKEEGRRMENCLTNNHYDISDTQIISLRDQNYKSRITAGIESGRMLKMIEGRATSIPNKKYSKYIMDLVNDSGFYINPRHRAGVFDSGTILLLMELEYFPEGPFLRPYENGETLKEYDNGYELRLHRPQEGNSSPAFAMLSSESDNTYRHIFVIDDGTLDRVVLTKNNYILSYSRVADDEDNHAIIKDAYRHLTENMGIRANVSFSDSGLSDVLEAYVPFQEAFLSWKMDSA